MTPTPTAGRPMPSLIDDGFSGNRPTPFSNDFTEITMGVISNALQELLAKIPIAEANYIFDITKKESPTEQEYNEVKAQLIWNRLTNRCCSNCGFKTDIYALKRCGDCKMTWYCNSRCQAAHWTREIDGHKAWCCNPNGPCDMGYMKTAIMKLA